MFKLKHIGLLFRLKHTVHNECSCKNYSSAVYTCIKKPESFSHSGFSLKVARQLPLNTPKKNESKNPPPMQRDFLKLRRNFTGFFTNVNARSNLAGIIRVFGHVVRDLQRNHPTAARDVMRTTRIRSKVERSRACAPLTKTQVWDSGFFAHALFVPKTLNAMGFSGSVNGTTNKVVLEPLVSPDLAIYIFKQVKVKMTLDLHLEVCQTWSFS